VINFELKINVESDERKMQMCKRQKTNTKEQPHVAQKARVCGDQNVT
jgi:hypothetical protein